MDWYPAPGNERKAFSMGSCCYYRLAMPLRELAKHGYDTVLGLGVEPHMSRKHDIPNFEIARDGHIRVRSLSDHGYIRWWDCDVLIFQRWMSGLFPDQIRRARSCGQVILQDIDDLFWELPDGHPAVHLTSRERDPGYNRDHYLDVMAASSGIIASTPLLVDYLEPLGVPVFLCRNAVDLDNWPVFEPSEELRVAWIGAIKWRAKDLEPLVGVLGPFLKEHAGEFVHVGHMAGVTPVWEQLQIPEGVKVTAVPLTPIWDYSSAWEGLSAVVVPLEDIRFNEAKSWLRGLEASACGMPFIAQDMPEYRALGTGRVAGNAREWREQLEGLLDPAVRRSEGLGNRERAEQLSIDRKWTQWADVLAWYGIRAQELAAA